MCLVALALDQSSRFPFVLAANRDEFYDRPAARLGWWEPTDGGPPILGGRDLQAGGTWLGLTAHGRLGLVTNVRDPSNMDPQAPSRGQIVPQWLKGDLSMPMLWPRLAISGYNGFNMLALDFADGECFWLNNRKLFPERLQKGVFGLSNAILNTPWPKVQQLKARTRQAIAQSQDIDVLANRLFEALADPTVAPDEQLPHTGISMEWERLLSSAFIKSPNGLYGTRCSTLVITERVHKRLVTHVLERTFTATSNMALLRRVTLRNWPPRHTMAATEVAKLDATLPPVELRQEEAFESSEVSEQANHALTDVEPVRKTRARSLIKNSRTRPLKV
ncbi:NRDE family protein [Aquabacterium sp. NJ1]|uniref:NRDE family protein n=1 Tax=Aquabacterium sp. NJ1 TaxID=1538295 RepID=UPI00068F065C|nr:NRDE family protein [Aquabacterium sp. NJ1]